MRVHRYILMLLFICLMALFSLQCNRVGNRRPVDESKVTVLYIGDERIFFQDYWGMEATFLVFLPLVAFERDEYGQPQPVLAEHWEHSEDYKIWKFKLRKNVRWHDGEPVTAHDIKFTMDMRQHPEYPGTEEEFYSV